jgi:hypothetical protein
VEKYRRARQATDNIIRRMRTACWIQKAIHTLTHTHTLTICNTYCFPLQQWLHESASILRYKYIASLELLNTVMNHSIQITNKRISIFMTYFIHNVLTNMFRPVFRPSSGWCYYYKNTNVQMCLVVSPSHVGGEIVNKIHHRHWSACCWLFIHYGPD